jgi:hypothetical protein
MPFLLKDTEKKYALPFEEFGLKLRTFELWRSQAGINIDSPLNLYP